MVEIKLTKEVDLSDHTLVEGFPGIGLVGTIASNYIIKKEEMTPIGYIYSEELPAVTPIHDGKPHFPIRIFKHPDKQIVFLTGELIIPNKLTHRISSKIIEFTEDQDIKKIISIGGMATTQKKGKKGVHGIISIEKLKKYMKEKNIPLIKEGAAMGVSGTIIAKATEKKLPVISLLVESRRNMPDPEAAADLVEKLNEMLEINVETEELRKEAQDVEKKMKKMVNRMKKAQKGEKKESGVPSPMYG